MDDFKLRLREDAGWILTIKDILRRCAHCGQEIQGKRYFCPEKKLLYCETCDVEVMKKHMIAKTEHEHFNIIEIRRE